VMDLLFFTKKKVLIIELTLNYHGLPNSMWPTSMETSL
jgi:hypothetical protein